MRRDATIVASVLGADYARLGQEVADLEAAGVDVLLVMTVNPGFGGQAYLYAAGARFLVAGSAVLEHPGGKRGGVAALRQALDGAAARLGA